MTTPGLDPREKRWSRIFSASPKVQIECIEVISSDVFESQRIDFDRATVVVGAHGVGKTLLLRTIEAIFGYVVQVPHPPFIGERSKGWTEENRIGGEFSASLLVDGVRTTRTVDLSWSTQRRIAVWKDIFDFPFGPWYTSPSEAIGQLQLFYQDYPYSGNGSRYNTEEFDRYSREDLNGIRNILGRDYDSVLVTGAVSRSPDGELEEVEGPHIAVTRKGVTTDSASMSLGEIWTHYVLGWVMARSTIEPVLIDEPESFLAARGHRPFVDEIARRALRRNSQFVIATHSPEMLSRFPLSNIRMCIQGDRGIRVIVPRSTIQVRDSVGIETQLRALVFVEDEFAKSVLNSLYGEFDVSLGRETEAVVAGSESKVRAGVELLSSVSRVRSIGVLDGDQRGDRLAEKCDGILSYLPGRSSPESELARAAEREADWLASELSCHTGDIVAALNVCASYDHQYWMRKLSEQLGFSVPFLLQILVRCWVRDDVVNREAKSLIDAIRRLVDGR